jgi:ATP-dependent DNA helicase DinG
VEDIIPFRNDKFHSRESLDRYERLQKDIVDSIVGSNKKYIAVNAPTGIGKSLIGMMSGYLLKRKVNYCCTTKALQNQILGDFPEAHVMMGKNNYMCGLYPKFKADTCREKCVEYKTRDVKCEYYDEKKKMYKASYRILNTTFYLCEANFTKSLNKQKLVIVDEADRLEDELCSFIGISLSQRDAKFYGIGRPKFVTKIESWEDWACNAVIKLGDNYPECSGGSLDREYIRALNLKDKLLFLTANLRNADNWIFNDRNSFWEFKPVWLDEKMAQEYMWGHGEKFVLMSATLPSKPVLCWILKINPNDMDYIEVEHPYKVENRFVYYQPVLEMKYKNKDMWYKVVDRIMDLCEDNREYKGIVHTCSYELRDIIMERGNGRFVSHDSDDKIEALRKFKESSEPLVYVSPSSERGISLDDDLGRFCIWAKVPWKNLGDKRVSKRVYSGKFGSQWYSSDAAMSIVQGAGRIVRNEDDWGKTYILDGNFGRLMPYVPGWFRDSIIVGEE